jgi:hypothetical protein
MVCRRTRGRTQEGPDLDEKNKTVFCPAKLLVRIFCLPRAILQYSTYAYVCYFLYKLRSNESVYDKDDLKISVFVTILRARSVNSRHIPQHLYNSDMALILHDTNMH